jgi:hypothetical protein
LEQPRGRTCIDDAVIKGETQQQYLEDHDLLVLFIAHDRSRDDSSGPEDRALEENYDRGEGVVLEQT